MRCRSTTATVVATAVICTLAGCATSDERLDAPIDWTTVDGRPDSSAWGLPPGDQRPPDSAPAVTWFDLDDVEIPVSPTLGPVDTDPLAACYAHSPSGALLAAVGLRADEVRHGNGIVIANRASLTDQTRDALNDSRVPDASLLPRGATGDLTGYRFETVLPDDVVVSLAWTSAEGGTATSARIRLVWENHDWKVVMQPDHGIWSDVVTNTSLDGYVRWEPQLDR